MKNQHSVEERFALFWIALELDSVAAIRARLDQLSSKERRELLPLLAACKADSVFLGREDNRIKYTKILVGFLPCTAQIVRKHLADFRSKHCFEIHFSLFCCLDEIPNTPENGSFIREVPILVGNYLRKVKSEKGFAAWMAGDLLGENWHFSKEIDILIEAALRAKFPAGRIGALHGLAHTLEKGSRLEAKRIVTVIREISKADVSSKVKRYAGQVLLNGGCMAGAT